MESAWWSSNRVVVVQGSCLSAIWRIITLREGISILPPSTLPMSLNQFNLGNYRRHSMTPGSTYCHDLWRADESSLIASNCQQESGGYQMSEPYGNLGIEIYNMCVGKQIQEDFLF